MVPQRKTADLCMKKLKAGAWAFEKVAEVSKNISLCCLIMYSISFFATCGGS